MMQSLIGMDYDRGLTMLKALIEEGKVDADTHNEGVNTFGGFDFIGIKRTSDLAEMPDIMQQDFSKIMQQCVDQAVEPEHVLSIYNKVNLSKQLFTYTSAISAESFDVQALGDDVVHGYVRQQEMLEIKHRGSYKFIGNAWTMGNMILRANKMKSNGKPFEYYHNDPADTPERELLTSVYFPVK